MYISANIAQKIKYLAKSKNVIIKDMLIDCGLGRNVMANLKTSMPKADSLVKIADYLNCSVDYLLGRSDVVELSSLVQESNNPQFIQLPQTQSIMLRLYDQPASAGTGNWLENNVATTWVGVQKDSITSKADFLIRISGKSMQPRYCDGDIVAIKKTPTIDVGEIGVFIVNGESYIKQMGDGQLISLNNDYKNIVFGADDDVKCTGVVLGITTIV